MCSSTISLILTKLKSCFKRQSCCQFWCLTTSEAFEDLGKVSACLVRQVLVKQCWPKQLQPVERQGSLTFLLPVSVPSGRVRARSWLESSLMLLVSMHPALSSLTRLMPLPAREVDQVSTKHLGESSLNYLSRWMVLVVRLLHLQTSKKMMMLL